MPDYTLPFPGRELADQELTYDVCYAKILPQDRASIVERAWRKGEQAARDIFVKYGGETDFFKIAALNLSIFIFSDRTAIFHQFKQIHVYTSFQHWGSAA